MLPNFYKTALRVFLKQKTHSIINIAGLSIGLAATLLIALFVVQEFSTDKFHEKLDRIYLLPMTWHFGETDLPTGSNCSAGGPFVAESFSEVENYVRVTGTSRTFSKGSEVFREDDVHICDSSFFRIFTFEVLAGNPDKALVEPQSIVITKSIAEKYFDIGQQAAFHHLIGETMISEGRLFNVTAVVADPPVTSHLKFTALISMSSMPQDFWEPSWNNSSMQTYILFRRPIDVPSLVDRMNDQLKVKYGQHFAAVELDLVPMKDVYLNNEKYPLSYTSSIKYAKIFSGIALLILIIAVVNYVNLTTARSVERAKEVGVRKVMGANQPDLVRQFLGESFFTVLMSIVIATGIAALLIPLFNSLTSRQLSLQAIFGQHGVAILLLTGIVISMLAGLYPAMVISGFQPIRVLKGKLKDSPGGIQLRKYLVVFQFCISIGLVACTLVMTRQINYMRNKDLGFDKDQLVSLSLDSAAEANLPVLRDALEQQAGIAATSAVRQLPVQIRSETAINAGSTHDENSRKLIRVFGADANIVETAGLTMVAGKDFSPTPSGTYQEVMINESAGRFFGWEDFENALGKKLFIWGQVAEINGVVKDFHFGSLKEEIRPLIIFNTGSFSNLIVRTQASDGADVVATIERSWKQINPDSPFRLTFLNDRYQSLYQAEARLGKMITVFSILAIIIALLGLFGLASYTVLQRTRELGIRKVLGANVYQLLRLVSVDFMKPVVIAFILAIPLTYYSMIEWLSGFSYRLPFSWMIVAVAGITAVILAAFTVIYHAYTIAATNPVKTLKEE